MNKDIEKDLLHFSEYLKSKYGCIRVIVSPPRCSSTALARLFWGHPEIRFYSHEPFEKTYYQNQPLQDVFSMLENPIDLNQRYASNKNEKSNNLLIKEMPYQVGHHFPFLASLTQQPILFLVRDPRHNIFSRIQKKLEAGSSPYFPLHETGWTLIQQQIEYCKESGIPFLVVNSDDFRGKTEAFTKALMQKVNLLYIPDQLSWTSAAHINLDNLEGSHSHLYLKVLASTGVLPPNEPIPSIELFPVEGGIRDHVYEAIEIYRRILGMEEILRIE